MKFRLPPDCLGISLAGNPLAIGENGLVEAEDRHTEDLAAHDAVPNGDKPPCVETTRTKPKAKR